MDLLTSYYTNGWPLALNTGSPQFILFPKPRIDDSILDTWKRTRDTRSLVYLVSSNVNVDTGPSDRLERAETKVLMLRNDGSRTGHALQAQQR